MELSPPSGLTLLLLGIFLALFTQPYFATRLMEDLDYIAAWTDCLQLTPEQHRVMQFYTAVCCVNFMSELGRTFNKEEPEPADEPMARHLAHVLDDLLERC